MRQSQSTRLILCLLSFITFVRVTPHRHIHTATPTQQSHLPIFISVTSTSHDDAHSSPVSLLVSNDGGEAFFTYPEPIHQVSKLGTEKSLVPERIWFLSSSVGWGVVGHPWYNASYLLMTIDGGRIWEQQGFPLVNHRYGIPHFVDGLNGWIVAIPLHPPYYFTSILHTSDGGLSWRITSILPTHTACDHITFIDTQHGWMQCWDEKSQNTSILVTEDGGKIWNVQYTSHLYGHGQLSFSSDGSFGFSGCYSRHSHIHHSHTDSPHRRYYAMTTDGMIWNEHSYDGYNMMSWIDQDVGYHISFNNTIQRTIDGGSTWLTMYEFDKSLIPTSILFIDTSYGYILMKSADLTEGYVYRTINGGATYSLQYTRRDTSFHCLYAPVPTRQYGCRMS